MTGPCLCGDTACGNCHPEGQTRMTCPDCGWTGKLCDGGFFGEDEDDDLPDGCPDCGQRLQPTDTGPDEPVEQPDEDESVVDERTSLDD